jgi:hydrogenase nickel incorporation protein HypA/HybF
MHEMGIASSILDAVQEEMRRYPEHRVTHRVTKVGLRIGHFAAVDPESLRFCFEALTKDTEFEAPELDIEWRVDGDQLEFSYLELEDCLASGVTV